MYLVTYLAFLQRTEQALGHSYRVIADGHAADADVYYTTSQFAEQCAGHAEALAAVLIRAEPSTEPEPDRMHVRALGSHRAGPLGLLRDLQDLYQLANLVDITWTVVGQAGHGARDQNLLQIVDRCAPQTAAQLAWLRMRMKAAAPQALLVTP